MTELKKCPFCGCEIEKESKSYYSKGDTYLPTYWVRCPLCGAEGPCADNVEQAREVWNRRVID